MRPESSPRQYRFRPLHRCRQWCAIVLLPLLLLATATSSSAQIRDDEIEDLLGEYARPILEVAGLGGQNVQIFIVSDLGFNAFVVNGRAIFINAGTLLISTKPNQIIGVLAHETGHIAGADLTQLQTANARARSAALMCRALGLAAAVGGVLAGGGGEVGQAGMGAAFGCQGLVQRNILAFRRIEESAADQAAVTYLNATKQSARGMLETFAFFARQGLTSAAQINPYLQSHPMPKARIAQLRNLASSSPYFDKPDPPDLLARHEMMRAKLSGFLEKPSVVFNKYPRENQTLPARYARAIATYRKSGLQAFLPQVDALIAADPGNPYFYEIKGQFLLDGQRPKQALAPLRKAIALAEQQKRKSSLIRIMLGRSIILAGGNQQASEAIGHLRRALSVEKTDYLGYEALSRAYHKVRRLVDADMARAKYFRYRPKRSRDEAKDDFASAKLLADRVMAQAPVGSKLWVNAQDFVKFELPKGKKK